MQFMLMFCADEDAWTGLSEEERAAAIQQIGAWFGEHARAGKIVEGRRLAGRSAARTVHLGPAGRSGRPRFTDGPFVESKEVIGSYAIVEVDDLEGALAVAEAWPAGGAVEVRPVVEG